MTHAQAFIMACLVIIAASLLCIAFSVMNIMDNIARMEQINHQQFIDSRVRNIVPTFQTYEVR